MSKTLFWYLLKDLLRIFMLASGTLAGIMSFGALLRPLTQHGLNAGQIGKILSYFSPAMTTYSFPVAALFATTMVYGRLSADNELTACRASGISHLAMTWPAFLLGLIVALMSLAFLSFVVPFFTLKVEKVIYSNIAQLIATKITRTHEVSYGKTTIFAQAAKLMESVGSVGLVTEDAEAKAALEAALKEVGLKYDQTPLAIRVDYEKNHESITDIRAALTDASGRLPEAVRGKVKLSVILKKATEAEERRAISEGYPIGDAVKALPSDNAQVVDLMSPMVFTYTTVDAPDIDPKTRKDDDRNNKMRVPSKIWMARRATAYITNTGDKVEMEAVLEEGGNFPRAAGGSQIVLRETQFGPVPMGSPIRENTKFMDVTELKALLGNPESSKKLTGLVQDFIKDEQRETYFNQIEASMRSTLQSFRFISETETLVVSGSDLDIKAVKGEMVLTPRGDDSARIQVIRESEGKEMSRDKARQIRITMDPVEHLPNSKDVRMVVNVRGYDVVVEADEDPVAHETFPRSINIPMPPEIQRIEKNTVDHYLHSNSAGKDAQAELKMLYDKLVASIRSEMHARASFAVSCLILVMVGCALGMISKSGNFLSAFAVSVVPALLCIVLIVTGQHVCEGTPKAMTLGLSLIWSGNVMVALMALFLLGGLHRQ